VNDDWVQREAWSQNSVGQPRGNSLAQQLDINSRTLEEVLHPRQTSSPARLTFLPFAHSPTMLRTAAIRALRAASSPQIVRQITSARPQNLNTFLRSSQAAPSLAIPSIRFYSAPAGLSKDEVQGRIMDLLKNFDKVCLTAGCSVSFLC
jgi:hypothetical protein